MLIDNMMTFHKGQYKNKSQARPLDYPQLENMTDDWHYVHQQILQEFRMSEAIARQWLEDASTTAAMKNHAAHMALISRKVSLQGVPGYEDIGYDDWAAQTLHEFETNVLKSVSYKGFKLIKTTGTHIMFKTFETVEANDGTINAQGIEILLEKEPDGEWRLVQERILPEDEARHDGLIS